MESDNTLPQLNVNMGPPEIRPDIVKADQLITYSNEILQDIREDRDEVSEVLRNFMEMVINEGDASQASKEALVNLIKIKTEIVDKKTRMMDLMLRAYNKDNVRFVTAKQVNNIQVENKKRDLLEMLDKEE